MIARYPTKAAFRRLLRFFNFKTGLIFLLINSVVPAIWGQEPQEKVETVWTESAVTTFLFNQAAFNKEWQGGGISNVAGNVTLTYNLNYNKNGVNWDTKVTAEYGAAKIQAQDNLQKQTTASKLSQSLVKRLGIAGGFIRDYLISKPNLTLGLKPVNAPKLSMVFR